MTVSLVLRALYGQSLPPRAEDFADRAVTSLLSVASAGHEARGTEEWKMMHLPSAPPSPPRPGFLELYAGYLSPTCTSPRTQHFLPCFPTALSTTAPPRCHDGTIECVIPVVVENVSERASKGMSRGCHRGQAKAAGAELNFHQQPSTPFVSSDSGHETVGCKGESPGFQSTPLAPLSSLCGLGHSAIFMGPPVLICDVGLRVSISLVFLGH